MAPKYLALLVSLACIQYSSNVRAMDYETLKKRILYHFEVQQPAKAVSLINSPEYKKHIAPMVPELLTEVVNHHSAYYLDLYVHLKNHDAQLARKVVTKNGVTTTALGALTIFHEAPEYVKEH